MFTRSVKVSQCKMTLCKVALKVEVKGKSHFIEYGQQRRKRDSVGVVLILSGLWRGQIFIYTRYLKDEMFGNAV